MFQGRITANEESKLLDNFWFERRAEPEFENSDHKAGYLNKEVTAVTNISNSIKHQRLQTRTLPCLVQAADAQPRTEDVVLLAIKAHL